MKYVIEFSKDWTTKGIMKWERYPETFKYKGPTRNIIEQLRKEGYITRYLLEREEE